MVCTKDNVKIGDELYVVPNDTREPHWVFKVAKVGNKYISNKSSYKKIEIGTDEIYRKDGCGSRERIYLNKEEYNRDLELMAIRTPFSNHMRESVHLYRQMSEEDIAAITKIMCKYDADWETNSKS